MSLHSLDPTARIRSVDLLLTLFFATSMDSSDEASLGGGFSNTVGNYAGPPTVVFEATPSCSNSIRGGDVDPNDSEPLAANHGGNEVYDESVGALLQETELIPAASDTARSEETVSASPDSVAARTTTQDSSVIDNATFDSLPTELLLQITDDLLNPAERARLSACNQSLKALLPNLLRLKIACTRSRKLVA
eukprot:scaffold10970_cov61-Cylindrotheca_fusiformis.AAC.2